MRQPDSHFPAQAGQHINKQLLKPTGRDLARLTWPGIDLRYCFGTGDPPDFRLGRIAARHSARPRPSR